MDRNMNESARRRSRDIRHNDTKHKCHYAHCHYAHCRYYYYHSAEHRYSQCRIEVETPFVPGLLGNSNICAGRKILIMKQTKSYKIWPKQKD